jgi:hypothetical protein
MKNEMNKTIVLLLLVLTFALNIQSINSIEKNSSRENILKKNENSYPLGKPGTRLVYRHKKNEKLPGTVVRKFELTVGNVEQRDKIPYQWIHLHAIKENTELFGVWLLCSDYPSKFVKTAQASIARFILQEGKSKPVEFVHQKFQTAILPTTGAWEFLLPRQEGGGNPVREKSNKICFLGHEYKFDKLEHISTCPPIEAPHEICLSPDLLTGVPHNTRQKDETRRYDESDYELIKFTKEDYAEMISAGLNCFRVDAEQAEWIKRSNVYYWGIGGEDVSYPECLYKSNYIGPVLFFDEPMVRTRDHVVKPKLKKNSSLHETLTPQKVLEDFKKLFHETKYEHSSTSLLKGLAQRDDVDVGNMNFLQQNMYTWETMVSSALYQLSEGNNSPPFAMVFEPPGRFGTRRILPELNMCFDCQIPADDPKNLISMIYGFLRGAARVTGKEWGVSIYGAVDRSDTFWFITHAYDLGASLFFYWDSYQLACVPFNEYLTMTKHLRAHQKNFPERNMERLKNAAEVAILIPPGYNMGHVHMGRGNSWAITELNLERCNKYSVTYRQVMSNFYTEIERCLRFGVSFDLFWNLEDLKLDGYREIVSIREDGKINVFKNGKSEQLESARRPERPAGSAPKLNINIKTTGKTAPFKVTARAKVIEGSAPIFYTPGADKSGVYNNQYVLWELFGPDEEDYSNLWTESWDVAVSEKEDFVEVEIYFTIKKPGKYRLRASTSDLAGRSTVVWKNIH